MNTCIYSPCIEKGIEKAAKISAHEFDHAIQAANELAPEPISCESATVIMSEILFQKMFGKNINDYMRFTTSKSKCTIRIGGLVFVGYGKYKTQARQNACKKFFNRFAHYVGNDRSIAV